MKCCELEFLAYVLYETNCLGLTGHSIAVRNIIFYKRRNILLSVRHNNND